MSIEKTVIQKILDQLCIEIVWNDPSERFDWTYTFNSYKMCKVLK